MYEKKRGSLNLVSKMLKNIADYY